MLPSNLPTSEPRRLLRRNTGRATPLGDRRILTAEEKNRIRERNQVRESSDDAAIVKQNNNNSKTPTTTQQQQKSDVNELDISDPYVSDRKVTAASLQDNSFGSNFHVLKRTVPGARVHVTNVVSVGDARAEWMDPSHRSERRNDHSIHRASPATKNDIQYVPERDTYVDSSTRKEASRNHYTDAERLALSNLQKSKDLIIGGSSAEVSVSRQQTSPSRNRRSTSSMGHYINHSQHQQSESKSFAQMYHERLNHLNNNNNHSNSVSFDRVRKTRTASSPASTLSFGDLQRTEGSMQHQIADATVNFFGGRHAPAVQQARNQGPRDSASRLLHGDETNSAGHHSLFDPVKNKNQETGERRKTRAIQWKQERCARDDFIHDRREEVAARQDAIANTKHERSLGRVQDPFRDVDYFLRREKGPRVVKDCAVRSENSKIGNWLFSYPDEKKK